MVRDIDYRRWIVYAILAVHIVWLIIHCFLSSQGSINQWKMSGYGMYTGPNPNIYLEVYAGSSENEPPTKINWYKEKAYRKSNFDFGFYCLETNAEKINILLKDNPGLVGMDMDIVVSGRFMEKNPISPTYQTVSSTHIEWIDQETYQYTSEVPKCDGKTYSGQGKFVAED